MSEQTLPDNAPSEPVSEEVAYLRELQQRPLLGRLKGYIGLSGPGWLQSALTLGGGSLAASLYLGVLSGTSLLWLQPLAMILGIIMLCAVSYVTLSTGRRPFRDLNYHITPLLGWTWLFASLMANIVWSMPQYSLATGAIQQNLLPGIFDGTSGKVLISIALLAVSILITWSYGSGHWGVRLYEFMLKILVGLIVLCFIIVVFQLIRSGDLQLGTLFSGFIMNVSAIFQPAEGYTQFLSKISPDRAALWSQFIVAKQQDVVMAAFATAVGINMTFLLPYSMLSRGWKKEHRGLSIFDLSTGMLIPFVLAATCVVVASANKFYAVPQTGLVTKALTENEKPTEKQEKGYKKILTGIATKALVKQDGAKAISQLKKEDLEKKIATTIEEMSESEKLLAASLVTRDVNALANALAPAFGSKKLSNLIFGIGVLGMALSTISLLMLISGFVVCELMNVPTTGWPFRLGCLLAAVGALGPFFWGQAAAWLAIPTSVFGLVLLPIAYGAFFILMNTKGVLKESMPTGGNRIFVNVLMGLATAVALFGSYWAINAKLGIKGVLGWLIFLLIIFIGYLLNPNRKVEAE